ncbi:glutamate--cysteine ligase [Corynebacterium sp. TAE3-ERU30]|uniref:glutamate--cysteine ligase n=1 Tax=Corynebacterium sp. TAE3-ERU30 TaxID=2849496 RepID=UPI001C4686C2|nr:glutamate--cysteine ligase [Corynebacterium sp. TAE3-ERU30]MBV7282623.1 glutamate--cysteine ligase [Corynebacterium sp. TAE3-ERU30]
MTQSSSTSLSAGEKRRSVSHHQSFKRGGPHTLGVEWEIGLIDPVTRDLVPRAHEVVDYIHEHYPEVHVEREFLANTVELITGVGSTVPEVVEELRYGLAALQEAAEHLGVKLWSAGSHPFADWREQPVSEKGPYSEIIERTQYWGRQMLIWGLHVHVSVEHEDKVWPLINALMTTFPHLLALSASSPGWNGLDTGYASNRTMLYQQLPTAGLPFVFDTWEQWSEYMEDQDTSGVISHTGSMHLDIRPAGKWGTIEVRACDAPSTITELAAIVALTHTLVVYFDRQLDAGAELPQLPLWHNAENKWRAARYGMDALVITGRNTEEEWVRDSLRGIITTLRPLAEELGCAEEFTELECMVDRPAAYARQRAVFEASGDWKDVVDLSIEELYRGRP